MKYLIDSVCMRDANQNKGVKNMSYRKKIQIYTTFFKPADAETTAKELQCNDPDWSYVPKHDPKGTGRSFIEIFDEDGFKVGNWGVAG